METTRSMATALNRLAIVGAGAMGEAILSGVLSARGIAPDDIAVTNIDAARIEELSRYGVQAYTDNIHALPAEIVMLAVKPQVIISVTESLAPHIGDSLVVSIAAGVPTERLEAVLPSTARVVRVMPNTPAMVGRGTSIVSAGSRATDEDVETVVRLLESVGEVIVLDESLQDAGMSISGSGPAYFELVVDLLADAGVAHGLKRDVAVRLATSTMAGAAELITRSGKPPRELIRQVTSPGGTTLAALGAMDHAGIDGVFRAGVDAAVARARELSAE